MKDKRRFDIIEGIINYCSIILLEIIATVGFIYASFICSLFFISLVILGIYLIYKNIIKVMHLKRKLKQNV